jgi:lipopolysaccharide cholinephosphotransferase
MFVNQNLFKKLIKTLLVAPIVKLYGYKKFCKKIDLLGQTYSFDECEKVADFTWGDNTESYLLKSELEPAADIEFEGRTFKAPAGWKQYLARLYGDWTQLPPEDQRIPHGFVCYYR